MSNVEEAEEIEEKAATRGWVPRLITGGKGPPEGPTINWLADYEIGTTFVCRSRNSKEVDLNLYHVVFKSLPGVVLLKWQLPDGKIWDYYVDPERFSKLMENPTILGVIKEAHEGTKDDGNRTDRLADLVLDETMPGEHR